LPCQTANLWRIKILAQWCRSRHDEPPGFAMLNLTRLHLGSAHESQFQGLGISGRIREPFGRHLWRRRSTHPCRWATRRWRRNTISRNAAPRKQRPLGKRASTLGRALEMPTRPAGLDPIVAEIIEALA